MNSLGFIRDDQVYFVVCCSGEDKLGPDNAEVVFCYTSGGECRSSIGISSKGELEVESWVNLKKPKAYGAERFEIISSKIPSTKGGFIESMYLEVEGERVDFHSTDFSLENLLIKDFNKFQKYFSYANGRHVDSGTVRYIARNNLNYSLCYKGVSPTVVITSFSIYCYKSLAVNFIDAEEAASYYEQAKKNINILDEHESSSGSIRVDFFSRELSIYTAYTQFLMAFGSLAEAKSILKSFFESLDKDDYSRYYYNLVRCLCFYMALTEENAMNDFPYEFFSRNLVLQPLSDNFYNLPHWYLKELSEALFILSHLLRIFDSGVIKYKDRLKLVDVASRVTDSDYYKRVEKNFQVLNN